MKRRWLHSCRIPGALTAFLLVSVSAQAQMPTEVFHSPSDDGGTCGTPVCSIVNQINLWARTPSVAVPSVQCPGAGPCTCGSDVCAVETLIEVEGGSFSAISAEGGVVVAPACTDTADPCTLPANTTTIHLVASFASQPAVLGPRRLATIITAPGAAVNSTAVTANGVALVNSEYTKLGLATNIFALPEPGALPVLAGGLVLALGLHARRARSRPQGRSDRRRPAA